MLTIRDYFLFVADMNAHNHECFGSSTTIRHGLLPLTL